MERRGPRCSARSLVLVLALDAQVGLHVTGVGQVKRVIEAPAHTTDPGDLQGKHSNLGGSG